MTSHGLVLSSRPDTARHAQRDAATVKVPTKIAHASHSAGRPHTGSALVLGRRMRAAHVVTVIQRSAMAYKPDPSLARVCAHPRSDRIEPLQSQAGRDASSSSSPPSSARSMPRGTPCVRSSAGRGGAGGDAGADTNTGAGAGAVILEWLDMIGRRVGRPPGAQFSSPRAAYAVRLIQLTCPPALHEVLLVDHG